MAYEYTWKCGLEYTSRTTMKTTTPLALKTIIIDLYDGARYVVDAIHKATPADREFETMPVTVAHVWPMGRLSESELLQLRERTQYKPAPGDLALPLESVVVIPAT